MISLSKTDYSSVSPFTGSETFGGYTRPVPILFIHTESRYKGFSQEGGGLGLLQAFDKNPPSNACLRMNLMTLFRFTPITTLIKSCIHFLFVLIVCSKG